MREAGLHGVRRGRSVRTTIPDAGAQRPADLVNREFSVAASNQLWVVDFTYVATFSGFVYVAFAIDVFSRMIVGWRAARSMRTDLPLDALDICGTAAAADTPSQGWCTTPTRAIRLDPVDRTPRSGRREGLRRLRRRQLRQRPRGERDRAVQDRTGSLGRTLARPERPRTRHPGLRRLVQPRPHLRRSRIQDPAEVEADHYNELRNPNEQPLAGQLSVH
jgi:hypothetical protein